MLRHAKVLAGRAALLGCLLALLPRTGSAEMRNVFALDGAQEVPACASPATATAVVTLRDRNLTVSLRWNGLSGAPTRIEIHGPAKRGERAPLLFRLALGGRPGPSDSLHVTFTVRQEQKKIFRDELAYLTLRTAKHPHGEIRGQIVPTDEESDEDD
jgi:hypothetical protein